MIKKTLCASMLVVSLALGATACASADVKKDKFESELVKKAGLTKTQAACVADKVYTQFDQDEINKLYTANDEKDLPKNVSTGFTTIVTECTKKAAG